MTYCVSTFYMTQRELLLGGGGESTARRRNLQYVLGAIFSRGQPVIFLFLYLMSHFIGKFN